MHLARRPAAFTAVLLTAGALGAGVALAAAGDQDPGFNGGAVALIDFPDNPVDVVDDVAAAPDGSLAVIGCACGDGRSDVGIARLTASGAPMTSFSGDGILTDDVDGSFGEPMAGAVDAAGDVYVGSHTDRIILTRGAAARWGDPEDSPATDGDFTIVRYAPDGARDGITRIPLPGSPHDSRIVSLVPQAGGGLLVLGSIDSGEGKAFVQARLTADGTLDPSFGAGGVIIDYDADADASLGGPQPGGPAGSAVLGGARIPGASGVTLRRYLADGSADPGYGGSFSFGEGTWISAGDVAPDGTVLALDTDDGVRRFTADGRPDASYGADGAADVSFLGDGLSYLQVLALPGGKALVLGRDGGTVVVGRLRADGSVDTTFGDGGRRTLPVPDGANATAPRAGLVQDGGKAVIAGMAWNARTQTLPERPVAPGEQQAFVTRLAGDPAPVTTITDPGTTTTTTQTTTPPPAATTTAAAAPVAAASAPKACTSRRSFKIRLRIPHGRKAISAVVKVNGQKVKTLRGARITAPVDLRGLPRGRFTVSIGVRLAGGQTLKGSRKYQTCVPKRSTETIPVL